MDHAHLQSHPCGLHTRRWARRIPRLLRTGAPITVGFRTSNSVGFGGISERVLYDNYNVTISTVPAPGPLALASLGGLLIAKRRRNA